MSISNPVSRTILRSTAAAALLGCLPALASDAEPLGVWLNDTGRGAVEIKPCGSALCGRVVWLRDEKDSKGCGKQIIGGAKSVGSNVWDGGWIYSPERGKTFDVELKPLSNGTLQVTGYAGVRFLSKTMIWTKAPADLKRCDAPAISAQASPTAPAAATPDVNKPDVKVSEQPASNTSASAATAAAAAASTVTNPASSAPSSVSTAPSSPAQTAPSATVATAPSAGEQTKAQEPTKSEAEKSTGSPSVDPAPAASAPSKPAEVAKQEKEPVEKPADDATASNDDTEMKDDGPPTAREKSKLKLGDLDLDKVFTRTKSGRCKLDLPFVKVQFDCDGN